MAKGWRKDDYNRQIFGQKVSEFRSALVWSLGDLAQRTNINKGTLLHIEKGESHLSQTKRQKLADVLMEALENSGHQPDRQAFLKVAGLIVTSATLHTAISTMQSQRIEIPGASNQEKLLQEKPHEEYAEELNRQHRWKEAETFWLLAAYVAKRHGNWSKWSRCLLNSGVMALSSGQFDLAESRYKEVIEASQDEMAMLAIVEAYVRLGWLYYEQDKFSQARSMLLKSRTHLQHVIDEHRHSLKFPEHGCTLAYEDNELIMALESTRLHWLGRTYVDWGIQQENQALLKEGVVKLQKAEIYDTRLGLPVNRGFELLRQIPAFLYQGELRMTARYLAQCEELLNVPGKGNGHFYLHKGLAFLEEQPKKAKDLLEAAHENFIESPFYVKGVSEVFKELSALYLMDNKKVGDQNALEYAFATVILHPYGKNMEQLQVAAHKMYWRLGDNITAFEKLWRDMEEKFWSMESGPFLDFRYFMKNFPENGISQVEKTIAMARKAVYEELIELR